MRFPVLPDDQWTPEQSVVADSIRSGPRGELRGPFVPLLYSPELAAGIQTTGEYIRFGNSLPKDLIEMAVLMTARHFDCANMWQSHRALAIKACLPSTIITALSERRHPAVLSAHHSIVYDFCSELLAEKKVSPTTFDQAERAFGKRGTIDLTGVCGYYSMLSMIYNVADIPLDPGSVPFEG